MNLKKIRDAIKNGQFEWKKHALTRLAQREIKQETVIKAILQGDVIEHYPKDRYLPSCLIFAMIKGKPIHAVICFDKLTEKVYIITTYEPTLTEFQSDFKTRRKSSW